MILMPRQERAEAKDFRKHLFDIIAKYDGQETSGYAISTILCMEEMGQKMPSSIIACKLPEGYPHDRFMVKNAKVSHNLHRMLDLGTYGIKFKIMSSDAPQDKKVWSLK